MMSRLRGGLVLPPLTGRAGASARVAYALLAFVTAIVVVGSLVFNGLDFFRNLPADLQWGFRTFSSVKAGEPPYVGDVSADAAARGLRVGNVPIAIAGETLPPGTSEYGIGRRTSAAAGPTLAMAVRRADGSRATVVLTRNDHPWLMRESRSGLPVWISSAGSFLAIELIPLFLLAASLLLVLRRPRDTEAMLFATGFLLLCNVAEVDFWLLALLNVPVIVMATAQAIGQCILIIAAAGFPQGRFDDRWSKAVLVLAVPVSGLSFWIRHIQTRPAHAELIAALLLLLLSTAAMIGLGVRYRRLAPGPAQQQVKWVVFGFCISALATVIYIPLVDKVPPGNIPFYVFFQILQTFAFAALPIGLVISLLRYRLYDAERAIGRSALYAVLTCSLVVIFAITEKLVELAGPEVFGGAGGAIAGALAAGVAAVLFAPLHHRIEHWAKSRFQRELVRLREGFPLLAGDLREVAPLPDLAAALLKRIEEGLPTTWLALVFDGSPLASRNVQMEALESWLAAQPALVRIARQDRLFPLRQPLLDHMEQPVGWLLLGPRPDESFYSKEDLALLDELAGHLARALLICRQREAADGSISGQIAALIRRIERVEAVVGSAKAD